MDFFDRQDKARRYTKWLLLYYPIALVLITGSVYVVVALAVSRKLLWNPELLAYVAIGTLLLIAGATLVKVNQLRGGGGAVAMMLGGIPVDPNTRDLDERKLLNVVEEMSIASGTPVPDVWLLRNEPGINAFAAGHDINDAAVAVTDGTLRLLTRDELQGVIAHEFSHILNGDIRLNVRVLGLLHGILIIAIIGRAFMRTRGRKNPLPPIGLGLFVIGSTGFFFGRLIKSAVSRQREYLADAAAVQFTRNPGGLADALKKIGGLPHGSVLLAGNAEDASHFFFANGMSGFWSRLMATHPPLEKRIRLLDPTFDGKYPKVALPPETHARLLTSYLEQALTGKVSPQSAVAQEIYAKRVLKHAGTPTPQHLVYASGFREELPRELYGAAHEPMEAMHVVFALLLSTDGGVRATQLQQLQKYAEPTRQLAALVDRLPMAFRLPLLSLTLPALKRLSPAQYQRFSIYMEALVSCDKQIDLFEYVLKIVVSRHVKPAPSRPVQYYSLRPLLSDCAVLVSALARLGHADLADANTAFALGMDALSPEAKGLSLRNLNECGLPQIDEVLTRLAQASPGIKKRVLHACAYAVAADNVIQAEEAELLRGIAETLDCPIPPFIQGVA
jgi:Zn-dependent protease with chaperone function